MRKPSSFFMIAALAWLPVQAVSAQLPPVTTDMPISKTSASHPTLAASGEELKGLLRLTKGECTSSGVKGTYFQMIDRSGAPISNTNSPCADKSLNPLAPGTDGGLSTSGFQPHPAVVFDGNGNALSKRITLPAKFFNVDFSVGTNEIDPQTKLSTAVPKVFHDGNGKITGATDLRAFGAAWNGNQATQSAGEGHYNQGSPKPDGQTPGLTTKPSGTYDATTRAFVIEWTSMIVGGAFDQNGGRWHLEGTFDPAVTVGDSPTISSVKGTTASRSSSGARLATTGPLIPLQTAVIATGAGSLLFLFSILPPLRRKKRR